MPQETDALRPLNVFNVATGQLDGTSTRDVSVNIDLDSAQATRPCVTGRPHALAGTAGAGTTEHASYSQSQLLPPTLTASAIKKHHRLLQDFEQVSTAYTSGATRSTIASAHSVHRRSLKQLLSLDSQHFQYLPVRSELILYCATLLVSLQKRGLAFARGPLLKGNVRTSPVRMHRTREPT